MQYYSKDVQHRDLFENCIHFDIIILLKIIAWKKEQDAEEIIEDGVQDLGSIQTKQQLKNKEMKAENFRRLVSDNPNFVPAKQKLMQPVYDFGTRDKINYKNKANWLAEMITRESTYNEIQKYDEKMIKIFEEDKNSDEEENFFDGSMYHEYLKLKNKEKKKPDKEK